MVGLRRSKLEHRNNVFRLKIRVIREDILVAFPGGQQVKNVFDPDPEAADTGPPGTRLGINGDAM